MPRLTRMYFIRADFSQSQYNLTEKKYRFEIYQTYTKEINNYARVRSMEDPNICFETYSKVLSERFKEGSKAMALLFNEAVVSIFFTSFHNHYIDQIKYTYSRSADEILITDIYTLLNKRRLGLYSVLFKHTVLYYRQYGYNKYVMWIMKHNRGTINAQMKIGFLNIFQTVSTFHWFGLHYTFIKRTSKYLKEI